MSVPLESGGRDVSVRLFDFHDMTVEMRQKNNSKKVGPRSNTLQYTFGCVSERFISCESKPEKNWTPEPLLGRGVFRKGVCSSSGSGVAFGEVTSQSALLAPHLRPDSDVVEG